MKYSETGKVVQQVKVLFSKSDDLSSIPRTHTHTQCVLCASMHILSQMHTINQYINVIRIDRGQLKETVDIYLCPYAQTHTFTYNMLAHTHKLTN